MAVKAKMKTAKTTKARVSKAPVAKPKTTRSTKPAKPAKTSKPFKDKLAIEQLQQLGADERELRRLLDKLAKRGTLQSLQTPREELKANETRLATALAAAGGKLDNKRKTLVNGIWSQYRELERRGAKPHGSVLAMGVVLRAEGHMIDAYEGALAWVSDGNSRRDLVKLLTAGRDWHRARANEIRDALSSRGAAGTAPSRNGRTSRGGTTSRKPAATARAKAPQRARASRSTGAAGAKTTAAAARSTAPKARPANPGARKASTATAATARKRATTTGTSKATATATRSTRAKTRAKTAASASTARTSASATRAATGSSGAAVTSKK